MYQRYTSLETFQKVMLTLPSLLLETAFSKQKSEIMRVDQNTSQFLGDRGPLLYLEWVFSSAVVSKIVCFVPDVRIIIYTNGKKVIGTFLLNLNKRSMFLYCNISRILLLASLALPCLASFAFWFIFKGGTCAFLSVTENHLHETVWVLVRDRLISDLLALPHHNLRWVSPQLKRLLLSRLVHLNWKD